MSTAPYLGTYCSSTARRFALCAAPVGSAQARTLPVPPAPRAQGQPRCLSNTGAGTASVPAPGLHELHVVHDAAPSAGGACAQALAALAPLHAAHRALAGQGIPRARSGNPLAPSAPWKRADLHRLGQADCERLGGIFYFRILGFNVRPCATPPRTPRGPPTPVTSQAVRAERAVYTQHGGP